MCPFVSADVRGGGRLRDEPKECLRRRLDQFPETKILGLLASRRMHSLVHVASRDKVDVDMFHKGIQYALEKLGKSKFGFESTCNSIKF